MEKTDIKSMEYEELIKFFTDMGEKPFRAKQVYQWMHEKQADGFEDMTNLSKNLREKLSETCTYTCLENVQTLVSKLDGTRKYLFRLADGYVIESVLMRYQHGNSVCISTQVGCRMGCRFCASTVGGLTRSLATSEILDQIYEIERHIGERVSNVIIMGIGEPLDNYENVIRFIRMLSDENGLHISQRNITLSTCGLVPKIYDLMREELTITLAISLHAPNDEIRREMMPVANRFSMNEIMDACRKYIEETGRRITFEYTMVQGTNDSRENALELAARLRGMLCHVNLIPLNAVEGRMGHRSVPENIRQFQSVLESHHINVTIRREMGSDIDAACGQLRNKNR